MDDLKDDAAITSMYRIDNAPPSLYLRLCMDFGHVRNASTLDTNGGGFRDDQGGAGALGIVLSVKRSRYAVAISTHSGEWRHNNPMRQVESTEP
jgi:hypothetical protein